METNTGRRWGWLWWLLAFLMLVVVVYVGCRAIRQRQFPYGFSHSCDRCLASGLENYADEHGGAFPAGEETPEASLSLLYPKHADAEILRGKIVPLRVVQDKLDGGERLTADTCGWHYVEGLHRYDNPKVALVWDKEPGLGHNGQKLSDRGHNVIFVSGAVEYVPGSEWDAFLSEQAKLLAGSKRKGK